MYQGPYQDAPQLAVAYCNTLYVAHLPGQNKIINASQQTCHLRYTILGATDAAIPHTCPELKKNKKCLALSSYFKLKPLLPQQNQPCFHLNI